MHRHIDSEWKHVILRNSYEKPCKRWGHRCLVIGNEVVIFGGFDTTYMNDLWVFNTETMAWRMYATGGDEQLKRSNFSMNYDPVNQRIVVYGGKLPDKKICNSIWLLEWKTKEWWQLEQNTGPAPEERKYHTAEILYPYFLVFGGEATADLDDLWIYNFLTLTWTEVHPVGPKPRARRFHSSVLIDSCLYIMGGCFNKYEPLNDMWVLDLAPLMGSDQASLHWKSLELEGNYLPRWGHTSTARDGKIYIFGGKIAQDVRNDLYVVDPPSKSVKIIPSKNQPSHRRRHSSVFFGRTLLVFGGFHGNYFDDFYCLTLNEQDSIPPGQLAHDMTELINSGKFDYSILTTSDSMRLYIHKSILKRKLGPETDTFIEFLETSTLKEATKALKEVYTGLDFSMTLEKLKSQEVKEPYVKRLLALEGIALPVNLLEKTKEGVLILPTQQWKKLITRKDQQYEDADDMLTLTSGCHTNLTIAKSRSQLFSFLLSNDFRQSNTHTPPPFSPICITTLIKYLEHDYAIVPSAFTVFDWLQLHLVANYYLIERLSKIALHQVIKLLNDANVQKVFTLAVVNRVTALEIECGEYEVLREEIYEGKEQEDQEAKEEKTEKEKKQQKGNVKLRKEQIRRAMKKELSFYINQNILKNVRENPEKCQQQ